MGINRDGAVIAVQIVGGSAADQEVFRERILSLEYSDHETKTDRAVIEIDNRDLLFTDTPILRLGTLLALSWGYDDRRAPARRVVVRGMKGFRRLTITAHGLASVMDLDKRRRAFENTTRADVARAVAAEHGFSGDYVDVADTTEVVASVVQAGESDAAFLARLARLEGYQFWVDHTGLHWRERPVDARPVRRIEYAGPGLGDVVSEPNIETDVLGMHGAVAVSAPRLGADGSVPDPVRASNRTDTTRAGLAEVVEVIDPEDGSTTRVEVGGARRIGEVVVAAGTSAALALDRAAGIVLLAPEGRISAVERRPAGATGPAAAAREARAVYRRSIRRAVKLSLEVVGDPLLAAKGVVEVVGIGQTYSQRYYVTEAVHRIGGTYTTSLKLVSDGHGGRSTASPSDLVSGRPRGGAARPVAADDLVAALRLMRQIVQARTTIQAARGNPDAALVVVERQLADAVARAESRPDAERDQIRGVVDAYIRNGRARGDDQMVAAGSAAAALVDPAPGEQKSEAKRNRQAVRDPLRLVAESEIDPDGDEILRWRDQ